MVEKTPIFLVTQGEGLIQMTPSAPSSEDELQELIAKYPQLIGDIDGELLLIQREHGIPASLDGAARWSIDHLFVTKQKTPVLVEVKRAVDTRLRREVVGQMMDYAANGVAYWPEGELRSRFERACASRNLDPVVALSDFMGEEVDPSQFWGQVDTNLKGGRIKLVFVADEIPAELARIVEFMNEQMTCDVRAIELRHFEGPKGVPRTLAPRIIGETERSKVQKSGARPSLEPIDVEGWLAKFIRPRGSVVEKAARSVLAILREYADDVDVASTQGSIYGRVKGPDGRPSYPLFVQSRGTVQFAFGWLGGSPAMTSDDSRKTIYDRFSAVVGPLSNANYSGFPSIPLDRLADPEKLKVFKEVTKDFYEICRQPAPAALSSA